MKKTDCYGGLSLEIEKTVTEKEGLCLIPFIYPLPRNHQLQENTVRERNNCLAAFRNIRCPIVWVISSKFLSTFLFFYCWHSYRCAFNIYFFTLLLCTQFISIWHQILKQSSYLATFCPLGKCRLYNEVGNNLGSILDYLQFYYPGNSVALRAT